MKCARCSFNYRGRSGGDGCVFVHTQPLHRLLLRLMLLELQEEGLDSGDKHFVVELDHVPTGFRRDARAVEV